MDVYRKPGILYGKRYIEVTQVNKGRISVEYERHNYKKSQYPMERISNGRMWVSNKITKYYQSHEV